GTTAGAASESAGPGGGLSSSTGSEGGRPERMSSAIAQSGTSTLLPSLIDRRRCCRTRDQQNDRLMPSLRAVASTDRRTGGSCDAASAPLWDRTVSVAGTATTYAPSFSYSLTAVISSSDPILHRREAENRTQPCMHNSVIYPVKRY